MIAANVALLLASIGFVYAVKTTSAANAAFLGSTTPLFGVIVARLFLGEQILVRTYLAIAIAFVGLVDHGRGRPAGRRLRRQHRR